MVSSQEPEDKEASALSSDPDPALGPTPELDGDGPSEPEPLDFVCIGEALVEFRQHDADTFSSGVSGDLIGTAVALARLGARTGFVQNVGEDTFAGRLLGLFRRESLDTRFVRVVPGANGICCSTLDEEGARRAQSYRFGTAASFTLDERAAEVAAYAASAKVLVFSGVSLATWGASGFLTVLREARPAVKVAFDPNIRLNLTRCERTEAGLVHTVVDADTLSRNMDTVLPYVDILLMSIEDEHIIHPGATGYRALEAYGEQCQVVVMKEGSAGCTIWTPKGPQKVAANNPSPLDTTGAGDAFNAGFLYGYLSGWAPERCAVAGNALAGLKVRGFGAINEFVDRALFEQTLAA